MSIKSILLPLTGYEGDAAALAAGLALAGRFDAFTDVLHVKPDSREAVPPIADGASGSTVAQLMALTEEEGKKRAAAAEALFTAGVKASGSKAGTRFITTVGHLADEVVRLARVHDLVLTIRVAEDQDIEWRLMAEAALMEGGRPILLLPAKAAPFGKVAALAWNGSIEAAHAATAALPLLAKAERVLLLEAVKGEPVEPTLAELGEWLGRHGIKAEPHALAVKSAPGGDELVAAAAAAGADLLVMGGYGHSRVRETIFGGATRGVLDKAALPVLLAH